ncbi:MAG: alr [Ilumatobacteraceae bacterium]|nr:alr [Ilumatobacteraceae bacterium]
MRWAWAEVDLAAIAHNIDVIRRTLASDDATPAAVWAVVKADGYGHGAVAVARTAIDAGAVGLCVALTQEGVALRDAGITAPILLLSEQPAEDAAAIVAHSLTPTVYTRTGIAALDDAARGGGPRLGVHLKVDTGMHRAGAQPIDAVAAADAIAGSTSLYLAGVFTHLAVADEPSAPSNGLQLERFDEVLASLRTAGHEPSVVHAANSAAALALPAARRDLVRLGIAMYGIEPGPDVRRLCRELRPTLSLHARVSLVKTVRAGEGVSYGLRHVFEHDAVVATVPIGYADGVPRRLFDSGGEVLLHGRRVPIVGVVTMDQLMLDCGDLPVAVGDEVVLIGAQHGSAGSDAIGAEEWAARLGTIGYEIVCGISKRIDRRLRPTS